MDERKLVLGMPTSRGAPIHLWMEQDSLGNINVKCRDFEGDDLNVLTFNCNGKVVRHMWASSMESPFKFDAMGRIVID